jgi:hypothetical protein
MKRPPPSEHPDEAAEEPDLPLLHSWRSVYLFVLGSFVLWVALLIILTELYS